MNRQIVGSHATGSETIKLLREVIASAKFSSFDQLCGHLVEVGDFLSEIAPRGSVFLPPFIYVQTKKNRKDYQTNI
jgi:translation initiation factor 2B subunit (eIF-2B alpha/beta/delta family)